MLQRAVCFAFHKTETYCLATPPWKYTVYCNLTPPVAHSALVRQARSQCRNLHVVILVAYNAVYFGRRKTEAYCLAALPRATHSSLVRQARSQCRNLHVVILVAYNAVYFGRRKTEAYCLAALPRATHSALVRQARRQGRNLHVGIPVAYNAVYIGPCNGTASRSISCSAHLPPGTKSRRRRCWRTKVAQMPHFGKETWVAHSFARVLHSRIYSTLSVWTHTKINAGIASNTQGMHCKHHPQACAQPRCRSALRIGLVWPRASGRASHTHTANYARGSGSRASVCSEQCLERGPYCASPYPSAKLNARGVC